MGGGASSKIYFAKQSTGPSESVGPQDPSLDTGNTYWSVVSVDDNEVLHKNNKEQLSDIKSFLETSLVLHNPEISLSENPESGIALYDQIILCGAGYDYTDESSIADTIGVSRLGEIRYRASSGARQLGFILRKKSNDIDYENELGIRWSEETSTFSGICPSTPLSGSNYDILTRDWIPKDTRLVHTTGAEEIFGIKTFNHSIINLKASYITMGVRPSELKTFTLAFTDSVGDIRGAIQCTARNEADSSNQHFWNYMKICHKDHNDATGNTEVAMYLGFDTNGEPYLNVPGPRSNPGNADVLTYGWINSWIPKDTRIVHTTGDENISGHKKFLNEPFIICNFTNNVAVSTNTFTSYEIRDKSASNYRLSGIEFCQRAEHVNRRDVKLFIYPATNNTMYGVSLEITNSGANR